MIKLQLLDIPFLPGAPTSTPVVWRRHGFRQRPNQLFVMLQQADVDVGAPSKEFSFTECHGPFRQFLMTWPDRQQELLMSRFLA
jgi:hypothetical protein